VIRRCQPIALALTLGSVTACSINRPVALTPAPNALAAYVDSQRPSDLLITDTAGHSRWVHAPRVDGDTLRGVPGTDLPPHHLAIPVSAVRSVAAPHFSAGRTFGLIGGILVTAGTALLIVGIGTHPVY